MGQINMFTLKKLSWGAAASAIALATVPAAYAQITSSTINGQVVDAGGNAVADATVTIQYLPTNDVTTARTSANGVFSASGLRVGGPYSVTVRSSQGAVIRENIRLQPSSNALTLRLEPVQGEDVITITGERAAAMDLNNGVGSVFSNDDILDQPSVERDLIATINRDPLASTSGTGQLSVAGSNPRFNGLAVDGALLQDDFGLSDSTYPTGRSPINLDAIESASLVASDYSVATSGFTGGLVNVITKSGTNEFEGSAFYYRRDEDYEGNVAFGDYYDVPAFDEEEYGLTLGGPILKDKLFFFVSYDEYETSSGANFSSSDEEDGWDPRLFTALNDLLIDQYGIDSGGRPQTIQVPETTERLLGKIDWNINDDHRASFTYQNTEETELTSISSREFQSVWYQAPVTLDVYTAQLFSDWTDQLSTEMRVNYKEFTRLQNCGLPSVGEIEISLSEADLVGTPLESYIDEDGDGTATVDDSEQTFIAGCDRYRHANTYEDERLQLFGAANYTWHDHFITAGAEYEHFELNNLFAQRTNGVFTFGRFDSNGYDDLINGDAYVSYWNAPTNEQGDIAAAWGYNKLALFAQDQWQVMPDLRLDYGLRYERYIQDDAPAFSQNVADSYGIDSSMNLDGLDLVLPRVSFQYTPFDRTTLSGGVGLFAGGEPKVWISNAFTPFYATTAGQYANVDPSTVPQGALDDIAAADLSGLSPIDVIDEDFEIPSDWKASLKLDQGFDMDFNDYGVPLDLGTGYQFSAQLLYGRVNHGFRWENIAQTELDAALPTGTAPDGRPIYADLEDLGIDNLTSLTNFDEGESLTWTLSLSNAFENGFEFYLSYANQDVESVSEGSSSRGISGWRGISAIDPNNPEVGTATYEVDQSIKIGLGYETEIFGDLTSEFNLFGQFTSGSPFFYAYDRSGNNSLFGRAGQGESPYDNAPLYVPSRSGGTFNDALVVFGSDFDTQGFYSYAEANGLPNGDIDQRYSHRSSWNHRWDFQYAQELPFVNTGWDPVDEGRLKFVVDIENVMNLLNDEWGTTYGRPSNGQSPVVEADLVSAADVAANGVDGATALLGDAPRTTCQAAGDCLYRYNEFDDRPTSYESDAQSRYSIRIGLRYDF